jgi:hypothetical protein
LFVIVLCVIVKCGRYEVVELSGRCLNLGTCLDFDSCLDLDSRLDLENAGLDLNSSLDVEFCLTSTSTALAVPGSFVTPSVSAILVTC